MDGLNSIKKSYPNIIKEIRGRGLMIGVEVNNHINKIKELAQTKNLLLNSTANTVIRLLPPLIIKIDEISQFINIFEEVIFELSNC